MGIDVSDVDLKVTKGVAEFGISVSASFYEGLARFLRFESQEIRANQKTVYAVSTTPEEDIKFLTF